MKKAPRRVTLAQDGEKGAVPPRAQVGGENGWGGRRHGLKGGWENCRLTVTLTRCDMEILGRLAVTVTGEDVTVGGQKDLEGASKPTERAGLDGIKVGGKPSHAAIIRRALRLLWLMEGG